VTGPVAPAGDPGAHARSGVPTHEKAGTRAGVVSRVAAAVIDYGVVSAIQVGILVAVAFARFLLSSRPFALPDPNPGAQSLLWIGLAIVYLTESWLISGRTVGARVMGLRVVRASGQPLGVGVAAGRAVFCVFLGAFSLAWSAVSRRNAAVHDTIFRTVVLYDWTRR